MEENTSKKEIIVKRLSAFRFSVEVSSIERASEPLLRETVIRKTPASTVTSGNTTVASTSETEASLIRHQVLYRIVETLLWRLIGEKSLTEFCGYPHATCCILLRQVILLSEAQVPLSNNQPQNSNACNGSIECFMEQVSKLLKICAPTPDLWNRFGWSDLTVEAILRKIYVEELSPNLRLSQLDKESKVFQLLHEIDMLLNMERRGYSRFYPQKSDFTKKPTLLRPFTKRIDCNEEYTELYDDKTARTPLRVDAYPYYTKNSLVVSMNEDRRGRNWPRFVMHNTHATLAGVAGFTINMQQPASLALANALVRRKAPRLLAPIVDCGKPKENGFSPVNLQFKNRHRRRTPYQP